MAPVQRLMPTEIGEELIELTRDICAKELAPRVDEAERRARDNGEFPREVFEILGRAGLLSLPQPEEYGGAGQPYEVYLQVIEEIASVWMSAAAGRACIPSLFTTLTTSESSCIAILVPFFINYPVQCPDNARTTSIRMSPTRRQPVPGASGDRPRYLDGHVPVHTLTGLSSPVGENKN